MAESQLMEEPLQICGSSSLERRSKLQELDPVERVFESARKLSLRFGLSPTSDMGLWTAPMPILWRMDYRTKDTAAGGDTEEDAAIKEIEKIARHSNVFFQFAILKFPYAGIGLTVFGNEEEEACVALSCYLKSITLLQNSLRLVETSNFWKDRGGKLSNFCLTHTVAEIKKRFEATLVKIVRLKKRIAGWEERIISPDRAIYEFALEIVSLPSYLF